MEKSYWSETYSIADLNIYAFERLDRGGQIFLKYNDETKAGRDNRVKVKLPGDYTVRDQRGRLDKRSVRDVEIAVGKFAASLIAGVRPVAKKDELRPLTLGECFERVLDISSGKYAAQTRRWEEVKRASAKLERILGRHITLESIDPPEVMKVWRTLARESKAAQAGGMRQAEVTVDALYSAANWLREMKKLGPDVLLPMIKWREKLKDEWSKITGERRRPNRPRHSAEELHRLFETMHAADVDPRFALAFDLGGEQRIGQVLRCRRSDIELPVLEDDKVARMSVGDLGVLRVRSSGHKRASPVMLTIAQRAAVDAALSGYLSDYEAAYTAGEIRDYYLFPAGRFRAGKAKLVHEPKPLTRDAALGMFRDLEAAAGVASIKGRGWYGVRRASTDLCEDVEQDERVLNAITGHKDSTVRRGVYQDGERPEVLKQAALTREKVRRRTTPVASESPLQLVGQRRSA
jgi:hypothetical protein